MATPAPSSCSMSSSTVLSHNPSSRRHTPNTRRLRVARLVQLHPNTYALGTGHYIDCCRSRPHGNDRRTENAQPRRKRSISATTCSGGAASRARAVMTGSGCGSPHPAAFQSPHAGPSRRRARPRAPSHPTVSAHDDHRFQDPRDRSWVSKPGVPEAAATPRFQVRCEFVQPPVSIVPLDVLDGGLVDASRVPTSTASRSVTSSGCRSVAWGLRAIAGSVVAWASRPSSRPAGSQSSSGIGASRADGHGRVNPRSSPASRPVRPRRRCDTRSG